jgi:hypothetical protein
MRDSEPYVHSYMPQKENILTWQRVPAHRIQFKRLDEEISFLLMLSTLVYFGLCK